MQVIHLHQNMQLKTSSDNSDLTQWLTDIGHGHNMISDDCVLLPQFMVMEDFQHSYPKCMVKCLIYNFPPL